MPNPLYYGDNLIVLRQYIHDESVDLIYLDPPFNSNASYNVLFAEHSGSKSTAQIQAFEDTWTWGVDSDIAYREIVEGGGQVSLALQAFHQLLGQSNMMAYLAMMAPRLVELHRVLKPSGSLYLHCDPTAGHYLKILLDAIFGPVNFRNEIIWKRTSAHSSANRYGPAHDIIYYYTKSNAYIWNRIYQPYSDEYLKSKYRYKDSDGRIYRLDNLTAAGVRHGSSGMPWRGIDISAKGNHWQYKIETLEELDAAGRIYWPPKGSVPQYKRYLDEVQGTVLQDVWTDIFPINSQAQERLGYPTQKPQVLLERIIQASSNPGDIVLDPFCGCGTAVAAAQTLNRQWIGIDITHLAIALIKHRLDSSTAGTAEYTVIGEPTTVEEARVLATENPYQFQWWALSLVGARPTEQKKGADQGIDGRLYFHLDDSHSTHQVIFSVKSGNLNPAQVRELHGVVDREKAEIGVLLTFNEPTRPMRTEALNAGVYRSPWGDHPKLQIISVGELLEGAKIDMPPIHRAGNITFKKAPRQKSSHNQGKLDF